MKKYVFLFCVLFQLMLSSMAHANWKANAMRLALFTNAILSEYSFGTLAHSHNCPPNSCGSCEARNSQCNSNLKKCLNKIDNGIDNFAEVCSQQSGCREEILHELNNLNASALNITEAAKDHLYNIVYQVLNSGKCQESQVTCEEGIFSAASSLGEDQTKLIVAAFFVLAVQAGYLDTCVDMISSTVETGANACNRLYQSTLNYIRSYSSDTSHR